MHTLWYTAPSGDELPKPTAPQVRYFMRQEERHWGPHSPVGVLEWHEHPKQDVPTKVGLGTVTARQQLLFIRHPKLGWYFEFSTSNLPEHRWVVPLSADADTTKYTKHAAFGEQLQFLTACFVLLETAERIVTDFIASREPSAAVTWANFDDLRPRLSTSEYLAMRRQAKKAVP